MARPRLNRDLTNTDNASTDDASEQPMTVDPSMAIEPSIATAFDPQGFEANHAAWLTSYRADQYKRLGRSIEGGDPTAINLGLSELCKIQKEIDGRLPDANKQNMINGKAAPRAMAAELQTA